MRKKLVFDLAFTILLVAVCVFVFGEDVGAVVKEMLIFWGIWLVLACVIFTVFGYALTRAMNPKRKKVKSDGETH